MIRYGFIRTKDEIKFLILTCMTYLPFPVSFDSVVDICTWCDEGFGYFELSEAFSELQDSSHIEKAMDNQTEVFSITQKGRETAQAFQNRRPIRYGKPQSCLPCVSFAKSAGMHSFPPKPKRRAKRIMLWNSTCRMYSRSA